MTFRYIIRPPSILTTPRLLKDALGARRTLAWPGSSTRKPSWEKDFFLTYPPVEELEEYAESIRRPSQQILPTWRMDRSNRINISNGPAESLSVQRVLGTYTSCREFASSTKPIQRRIISSLGLPIPWTCISSRSSEGSFGRSIYSTTPQHTVDLESPQPNVEPSNPAKYIVRPYRHTAGQGYRLTSSPTDFEEGREYIQEVYPKNHEYRVITVRGEPLITLYKRRPEGLAQDQPWNHANGSNFVTVLNPDNNRLRHTDIYERIRAAGLLKHLDLVGIDVMIANLGQYVITEFNLCPAITIEQNLQRIKEHVFQGSVSDR